MSVLLGTNTATIVRRDKRDSWAVAAQAVQSSTGAVVVYCLRSIPGTPSNVWAWMGQDQPTPNTGDQIRYATSLDGGFTWSVVGMESTFTTPVFPLNPDYYPEHGQQRSNLVTSINISRDELGRIYTAGIAGNLAGGGDPLALIRLDDYAGSPRPTWLSVNADPILEERAVWAVDGYLWFVYDEGGSLWRGTYDGGPFTEFVNTINNSIQHWNMTGKTGSGRLYLYQAVFKSSTTEVIPTDIYSIDISNPNSPVVTFVLAPFDEIPIYIEPVDNQLAYAHTITYDFPITKGSIWKTTDAGLTWQRVAGPTTGLAPVPKSTFFSTIMYQTISAPSAGDVWVAGKYPFVYHSIDGGAIWQVEQASGITLPSPGDQFSGSTQSLSWTAILAGPAYPGIAKVPGLATPNVQDWFTKTDPNS